MKHSILIAVSIAALSLAGCGKKAETPAAQNSEAAANGLDGTAAPAASPGQAFADAAAASDTFEIETSKLAQTKSQSAKVKRFAGEMIKAHTASTAKLKTAAGAASPAITPSPTLTPAQQQTLDALSAKSGADFDKAYADAQRSGHQATLDALKAYSTNGDVPSLKAFATELVPTVTAHLNMAKGL
jgi:putative membrane protein